MFKLVKKDEEYYIGGIILWVRKIYGGYRMKSVKCTCTSLLASLPLLQKSYKMCGKHRKDLSSCFNTYSFKVQWFSLRYNHIFFFAMFIIFSILKILSFSIKIENILIKLNLYQNWKYFNKDSDFILSFLSQNICYWKLF